MTRCERLLKKGFQSSSGRTPEFKRFATFFRNDLKKALAGSNACLASFSTGHFYVSGFVERLDGAIFYFSTADVRFFPVARILVRTAKGLKDFTGGPNHFVTYDQFFSGNFFPPSHETCVTDYSVRGSVRHAT